jgi:hypothetical protein
MRTPDRWDWNDWIDPNDQEPVDPNKEHLIRWTLMVVVCLFLASHFPVEVMAIKLSGFLLMGAVMAAIAAGLRQEPVFAPHFTWWDEAAASATLGLLVHAALPLFQSSATRASCSTPCSTP